MPGPALAERRRTVLGALAVLAALLAGGCGHPNSMAGALASPSVVATSPSVAAPPPSPAPPAANLKTIDYSPAPKGFPADADPMSTKPVTEGLHPTGKLPVYDAPGGTARAYLNSTLSGVKVVVPIVEQRSGWVAVLLPSANRTVGWLPKGGWTTEPLRDHVVVKLKSHELGWYRDGSLVSSWTVTIGSSATPTPLGRTFVLGRTKLPGTVYAGVDGLALGAVPDDPGAVATGLQGAHIGIHAWYKNDFGFNKSNGCVRMPKVAMQTLLDALVPGTEILVLS